MKKVVPYCLVAVLCAQTTAQAQTLEEVNLDGIGINESVYLTDINDKGFICGYKGNSGFVINPEGKLITILPIGLGSTIKVEGINNNNTVVIYRNSASGSSVQKADYDLSTETYSSPVDLSNIGNAGAVPFGINNLSDFTGWFMTSTRFHWVKHDTTVPPGNSAWEADRYQVGTNFYNTVGTGINDNNLVCGYYIDGASIISFVYNNITHTYWPVTFTGKIKFQDINNSGKVVGEFQQSNGYYMAFMADVSSTGVMTNFTSLASLFDSPTIQSVANGINEKGEIVGSYLHPGTNTWVGFIYRPNQPFYRLPGFDFNQHTYTMHNSTTVASAAWNPNYYNDWNYSIEDPYASYASPIVDAFYTLRYKETSIPNDRFPSWRAYMAETDTADQDVTTDPARQARYSMVRALYVTKWAAIARPTYPGLCYGFANAPLYRVYRDNTFSNWFGLPTGINLSTVVNTDDAHVQAIERLWLKQLDRTSYAVYGIPEWAKVGMWTGMYRLKNTFNESIQQTNPRTVTISLRRWGYHSVLPYKIKTPSTFPFHHTTIKYDSLFVYDSNRPLDSNQYFLVNTTRYIMSHDSVHSGTYPDSMDKISFNTPGVHDPIVGGTSWLKTTAGNGDHDQFQISLHEGSHYHIADTAGHFVSLGANGYLNNSYAAKNVNTTDTGTVIPLAHRIDTSLAVTMATSAYADSFMRWDLVNNLRSMALTRHAVPGETDFTTISSHEMTYGTHDAAPKSLNGFFTEIDHDYTQGVNMMVSALGVQQHDSLITDNPQQFIYRIRRIGGAPSIYNLWVYTLDGDSVKQFIQAGLPIQGNATHTINGHFNGPNGPQTAVLVDNGNDGTTDDTLFITYVPLSMNSLKPEQGTIRMYPNPAQNSITLSSEQSLNNAGVRICDLTGRTVGTVSAGTGIRKEINISHLAPGVYFVRVIDHTGKVIFVEKLIRQ